jgi:methyl-accepting chemotaxis protein
MSDITVTLGAKDEGLSSSLSGLRNQADETSKGFGMSFGKIAGAAALAGAAVKVGMLAIEAATAGARAVVDGFGDAIDLGGKLNDLSSRTGESAGNLLVLQRAFENTGVGADKVGTSVNKLQKFMTDAAAGGADQTATLNALGVSMSDLAGKTPTEQMGVLAGKIASISDPAERARASMEVFGKSGGELLPLLNNFGAEIEGAKGQLGDLPNVMDRSAGALDSLGDNLSAMGSKTMEFAAGFIESALPALNSFTSALSGIDAAGWGAALMDQVMKVADFLIGAFKAPMPAIEALGLALMAGIKITGNALLNGFITASEFLGKYLTSGLPFEVIKTMGSAMGLVNTTFAKGLVDAIIGGAKMIETGFSTAVNAVVSFFSTGFQKFVSGFAEDFKNAMSDPIGFVTGKFKSGLDAVTQGGAGKFQSAFDGASGSVLDKVSAGLGAAADGYRENLSTGVKSINDGFKKITDSIEPSAKDFFGAVPAASEASKKLGEVTSIGTTLREDFEASAKSAEDAKGNTKGAAGDAESVATSFSKAEGSAKKMKEELSASAKLLEDVTKAEAKNAVDKGGKLAKKASDQMASGDFSGARRTARQIANNEAETNLRGFGANKDRRALEDIGRQDYGIRRDFGESQSDFRERIRLAREEGDYGQAKPRRMGEGKPSIDKPGQDGTASGKSASDSKPKSLDSIVQSILDLVKKIEPKLPQTIMS